MPMPPFPIYCMTAGCKSLAAYKIAGRWSDGQQSELKTFALCCGDCLPRWFHATLAKHGNRRRMAGETVEAPGIYGLERGKRDRELTRLQDMESQLSRPTDERITPA